MSDVVKSATHHQNRWIRGFSRIGLVFGFLAALAVIGFGLVAANEAYQRVDFDYDKLACLLSEAHNQPLQGDRFKTFAASSRCGFFSEYDTYTALQWQEFGRSINKNGLLYVKSTDLEKRHNTLVALAWTAVIAAATFTVIFLICWTLGWIFAGFAKT